MDWHPIQGGVEILLVASCHGNWDKLRPDGPSGSYAETLPFFLLCCEEPHRRSVKLILLPFQEEVMMYERVLLQTIKFDLQVEHPYPSLLKFGKALKGNSSLNHCMIIK